MGFTDRGIPAGGIFAGAEAPKTKQQVRLYGGVAGEQLDPCYHLFCDRLSSILDAPPVDVLANPASAKKMQGGGRRSMEQFLPAMTHTIWYFAEAKDPLPARPTTASAKRALLAISLGMMVSMADTAVHRHGAPTTPIATPDRTATCSTRGPPGQSTLVRRTGTATRTGSSTTRSSARARGCARWASRSGCSERRRRSRPPVYVATGSVALFADLIHNFGDALAAVPLGAAFLLRSARVERYAGVGVVLAIFVSACVAGVRAIEKFISQSAPEHLLGLGLAGAVGFAGNEIAAQVRLAAGRRLDSPALVADGYRARTDGFVSLGVMLSAGLVALGAPIADPIIAIAITVVILRTRGSPG